MRRAVLLLNFGTPDGPHYWPLVRYLRQMLTDPLVLNVPTPLRLLLGGVLIPLTRARRSAAAYRSIWQPDGSPLLIQTERLTAAVQGALGEDFRVWYAMRLGRPSIPAVLHRVRQWQPEQLTLLPLYPQYAAAATGTAVRQALQQLAGWDKLPELRVIHQYADHPDLAAAFAAPVESDATLQRQLAEADRVLFSFHGLPVSQLAAACRQYRADCPCTAQQIPAGTNDAGEPVADSHCYRAACYRTARAIAGHLHLPAERWSVSFQSRLRNNWQAPFTDRLAVQWARAGVRKLFVFCPSFTVDCLETLEEIGLQLSRQFRAEGGQWLRLAPCPGVHQNWVQLICQLVQNASLGSPPATDAITDTINDSARDSNTDST